MFSSRFKNLFRLWQNLRQLRIIIIINRHVARGNPIFRDPQVLGINGLVFYTQSHIADVNVKLILTILTT